MIRKWWTRYKSWARRRGFGLLLPGVCTAACLALLALACALARAFPPRPAASTADAD